MSDKKKISNEKKKKLKQYLKKYFQEQDNYFMAAKIKKSKLSKEIKEILKINKEGIAERDLIKTLRKKDFGESSVYRCLKNLERNKLIIYFKKDNENYIKIRDLFFQKPFSDGCFKI